MLSVQIFLLVDDINIISKYLFVFNTIIGIIQRRIWFINYIGSQFDIVQNTLHSNNKYLPFLIVTIKYKTGNDCSSVKEVTDALLQVHAHVNNTVQ